MRKLLFFWIAVFWTLVVAYLCLTPSTNIPKFTFLYLDKLVHFFFHFVFTALWILFFKIKMQNAKDFSPYLTSFSLSVFFGITIEIVQGLFTTTRSADVFDVFANIFGATIGVLAMALFYKIKKTYKM
ncbi:VanZ family protein [Flavobacterium muglaense]|uniref:VanZ family protein n=1 Tax=Flavobacterium muglaense TaxID=2764716 RepID=A0A923MWM1_9FLAO|nr:VanZ family protein [Flavobacterium muglaense]MBC5837134.1 VanZ family protein [Flavobacterium muglaense]MBC5843663.1 VanZ family protein [Flavobacterium muglaense]